MNCLIQDHLMSQVLKTKNTPVKLHKLFTIKALLELCISSPIAYSCLDKVIFFFFKAIYQVRMRLFKLH